MRIYLTSVAESKQKQDIKREVKKLFTKYRVVVIPSKYASREGKKQIKEYRKKYYEANKEKEKQKRRERYKKEKEKKATPNVKKPKKSKERER